jgi:hypothetical protein
MEAGTEVDGGGKRSKKKSRPCNTNSKKRE